MRLNKAPIHIITHSQTFYYQAQNIDYPKPDDKEVIKEKKLFVGSKIRNFVNSILPFGYTFEEFLLYKRKNILKPKNVFFV